MKIPVLFTLALVALVVLISGCTIPASLYGVKCMGSISGVSITEDKIIYNIAKNPIDVNRYQNPGSVGLCLNVADVHRITISVSREVCNQYAGWWPGMQVSWQDDPWECRINSLPTKTDNIEVISSIAVSGTIDPMYQGREGTCTVSPVTVTGMGGNYFSTSRLDCIRSRDNRDVSGALSILYSVSGTVTLSKIPEPYCGDGICQATESCEGCPEDCGTCPVEEYCSDGICQATETSISCPGDCPADEPPAPLDPITNFFAAISDMLTGFIQFFVNLFRGG